MKNEFYQHNLYQWCFDTRLLLHLGNMFVCLSCCHLKCLWRHICWLLLLLILLMDCLAIALQFLSLPHWLTVVYCCSCWPHCWYCCYITTTVVECCCCRSCSVATTVVVKGPHVVGAGVGEGVKFVGEAGVEDEFPPLPHINSNAMTSCSVPVSALGFPPSLPPFLRCQQRL